MRHDDCKSKIDNLVVRQLPDQRVKLKTDGPLRPEPLCGPTHSLIIIAGGPDGEWDRTVIPPFGIATGRSADLPVEANVTLIKLA